jgi:hypothetical protein
MPDDFLRQRTGLQNRANRNPSEQGAKTPSDPRVGDHSIRGQTVLEGRKDVVHAKREYRATDDNRACSGLDLVGAGDGVGVEAVGMVHGSVRGHAASH